MTSSPKSTLAPALSSTNPFASNFELVTSFADPGFCFSAQIKFTIGPRAGNLKNENEFLLTIPICSAVQYKPSDSLDSSDETFKGFTERELDIVAEKILPDMKHRNFFPPHHKFLQLLVLLSLPFMLHIPSMSLLDRQWGKGFPGFRVFRRI